MLPSIAMAQSASPAQTGSISIHRYLPESYSESGLPNDGSEITSGLEGTIPIEGITYTIYQMNVSVGTQITADNARDYVISGAYATAQTGSDGIAVFSALPEGYYYVVESDSLGTEQGATESQYYTPVSPFVVRLPLTSADGASQSYDVHVYPKSETIAIDKFVNEANDADPDFSATKCAKAKPVSVADTFGWTIEASLPTDIGAEGREYFIADSLPDSVVFDIDSICVYTTPAYNTPTSECYKLALNVDYTLTLNTNNSFTLTLTDAGRANVQNRIDDNTCEDSWLRIKYNSSLSESAAHGVCHFSNASVTYAITSDYIGIDAVAPAQEGISFLGTITTTTPGGVMQLGTTTITSTVAYEPEVHTGQIKLYKYDANNTGTMLEGAEFGLATSQADALAGNFIATGTTDANGELVFSGLAYGANGDAPEENTAETSYWLAEITAPEGYVMLDAPFEVKFDHHINEMDNNYYFAELQVYNQPVGGSSSSSSSSSDTTSTTGGSVAQTGDNSLPVIVFVIVMAVCAVGIIVLVYKRKANKKNQ